MDVLSSNIECLFKEKIQEEDVKYVKVYSIIIGYVLSGLLLILLIGSIIVWCMKKKKANQNIII